MVRKHAEMHSGSRVAPKKNGIEQNPNETRTRCMMYQRIAMASRRDQCQLEGEGVDAVYFAEEVEADGLQEGLGTVPCQEALGHSHRSFQCPRVAEGHEGRCFGKKIV